MMLGLDSETRDAIVRVLMSRPIPMVHVEDVVNTLRALKPEKRPAPPEAQPDEAGKQSD